MWLFKIMTLDCTVLVSIALFLEGLFFPKYRLVSKKGSDLFSRVYGSQFLALEKQELSD